MGELVCSPPTESSQVDSSLGTASNRVEMMGLAACIAQSFRVTANTTIFQAAVWTHGPSPMAVFSVFGAIYDI